MEKPPDVSLSHMRPYLRARACIFQGWVSAVLEYTRSCSPVWISAREGGRDMRVLCARGE